MDAELLELQRQLESAQQAKSSVRLSERNIVELVQKLRERGFIDFELLHTVSGKEYITADQLRLEIEAEIKKSGRVSLIDLSEAIGVDLYYVERLAKRIVADDPAWLMLINSEVLSQTYWDSVAEEINEKLQECSQIAVAELAANLHVGSELVVSVLEPRLGTLIKGRLEGGQLYTPAYVSRIKAMVRGASRAITVPTNLPTVWNSLQLLLHAVDGATGVSVEGTFFQSLFNGIVKEGGVLGSLRAGVQWTPAVFAHAQRESVDSLFSQNSFISYDVLHKLAIPQPKQYLQIRYPEGITLDEVFIHPSIIDMLDSAVEDSIENGNWIDSLVVLPTFVGRGDASKVLFLCPSVQRAIKSFKAIVLGGSCIFSNSYIKDLFCQIEKEIDTFSITTFSNQGVSDESHLGSESQISGNIQISDQKKDDETSNTNPSDKGVKKRRGKSVGSSKASENDSDLLENLSKSKKNQRKSRDTGLMGKSDTKSGSKRGLDKDKDDNMNVPTEEWVEQKILAAAPDLVDMGDDSFALVQHLSLHLRPMLISSLRNKRSSMLSENADKKRRLLESLQKQLDESLPDLQLNEKALDLFTDDHSISVTLHRHLLKTTGAVIADKLLLALDADNKLNNGIEIEDTQSIVSTPLSSVDRISLVKSLPASLSSKALAVAEALDGKQVASFMAALQDIAEESGLSLKKLDKKLERALLHSYRKDLISQISSETEPIALLPKVVCLLYLQIYNKYLQAPGRAISTVLSLLKDKLPDSTYKALMDYHASTVTLLSLQAAASGDEENCCSSDRILIKKELLESMMPELKALVLGSANP